MKKRLLSLLLTLVMILGMIPATALTASAAEITDADISKFEQYADYMKGTWGYFDSMNLAMITDVEIDSTGWLPNAFTAPSRYYNSTNSYSVTVNPQTGEKTYSYDYSPVTSYGAVTSSQSKELSYETFPGSTWIFADEPNRNDYGAAYLNQLIAVFNVSTREFMEDPNNLPAGAYITGFRFNFVGGYPESHLSGFPTATDYGVDLNEYINITVDGKKATRQEGSVDGLSIENLNPIPYTYQVTDTLSAGMGIGSYCDALSDAMVWGPVVYVYDEKPEINSVTVNGQSVADEGTFTTNNKNVTIKTTYDSVLSDALTAYGCKVEHLSDWYLNDQHITLAKATPVDQGDGTSTKTYTRTLNGGDVLKVYGRLEVTWPDGSTDRVDEHTMTVKAPISISAVNVGATFSGTPANATSNTDGITVTGTQWYRQNGSTWTALTSSDTIKEGYTYRCEVTVAANNGYTLADGYTVKINGTAATKKSRNTWYRDVTITGYTAYVDVYDIALPEAYTNPDFTYNDEEGAAYHWDVVQVEWFECDKDDYKLSGALTENDVFKKDTYYRIEVTVVPETSWQFDGSELSFYINDKPAMPLYGYNKAYPGGVTGYVVYNTADIEGTYTLYVYDNSLTGSAKDILIEDGQYLGSDATAPTTTQPASGGYAYYKNGVLLLNNYNNEDAHFVFEEGMLDLYLKGDNTIGAICDHSYLNVSSALDEYRNGSLTIDGEETASLFVAGDALDAYCSIFVENELYINGGDITVTLGENSGDAVYAGGGVTVADDYTVYVNSTENDFAAAHKWDGSVSLDKYHTVWFKDLKHQFTTQPTGGIVATGDTHTVSWKTNFTPEQIIVEAWKSSGGSYKASREYYSGTTTSVELPALSSGGHYYIIAVYDDGSVTSDVVYVTEVQAITDVTLSVVDPVAGKNPSFTVTLPQDAPYEHAVNEAFWIDRTDSSKALTETDTFVAGHEYIVTVRLKAKDGYRFLKDESDITVNVGNTQDFIKRLVINENEYLEVVFVLTATDGSQSSGVNVSGTVTSFNSNTDTVTIQLIKEGTSEAAYEATVTGNSATYTINDVVAGTYTLKVMKANHVTREYTVTVGSTAVTQDAKIHLLGDINGDGKVTTIDFGRANAHAKGTSTLTGYELLCADTVKQDGLVTTADAARINAHARGTSTLW